MARKLTPIDKLIDQCGLTCTRCNKPAGSCACWETCARCGWSFEVGKKCRNPIHTIETVADQLAASVVAEVIGDIREKYPVPMKFASGGFQKSLRAIMLRRFKETLVIVYEAVDEAKP